MLFIADALAAAGMELVEMGLLAEMAAGYALTGTATRLSLSRPDQLARPRLAAVKAAPTPPGGAGGVGTGISGTAGRDMAYLPMGKVRKPERQNPG